jgi:hypothetical protein
MDDDDGYVSPTFDLPSDDDDDDGALWYDPNKEKTSSSNKKRRTVVRDEDAPVEVDLEALALRALGKR